MLRVYRALRDGDARPILGVSLAVFGLVLFGCMGLEFSPDGKHIAFYVDGGDKAKESIAVIGTDGTGFRYLPLSEDAGFPCWTPDSKGIYYASKNGLMLFDVEMRQVRRVAPGKYDLVRVSSDGTKLAAWLQGDQETATLVWFDAGSGTKLGEVRLGNVRVAFPPSIGFVPATDSLVYQSEAGKAEAGPTKTNLFLVTELGKRQLTTTGDVLFCGPGFEPGEVLWTRSRTPNPRHLPIFAMDVRSGRVRRVATVDLAPIHGEQLDWAAFGPGPSLALAAHNARKVTSVYAWKGQGVVRKLGTVPGVEGLCVAWSHDGKQIAATDYTGGLWQIDAETGRRTTLRQPVRPEPGRPGPAAETKQPARR